MATACMPSVYRRRCCNPTTGVQRVMRKRRTARRAWGSHHLVSSSKSRPNRTDTGREQLDLQSVAHDAKEGYEPIWDGQEWSRETPPPRYPRSRRITHNRTRCPAWYPAKCPATRCPATRCRRKPIYSIQNKECQSALTAHHAPPNA